jgi:hypothetical protein
MTRQQAHGLTTEREAVAGRAKGRSQRAIATDLGVGQPAVSRALQRARRRLLREISTEAGAVLQREHREAELVRDQAWRHWAQTGDLAALDRVLAAGGAICNLYGIGRRAHIDLRVRRPDPVESLSNAELLVALECELAEERARLGLLPAAVADGAIGPALSHVGPSEVGTANAVS